MGNLDVCVRMSKCTGTLSDFSRIIMPIVASGIIGALLYYQRKAKKQQLYESAKLTLREFCSQLDLGGSFLLAAGFAMFLIPFSLAATSPGKWSTSWIIALIVIGFVTLIGMLFYERYVAAHPILPAQYLRNGTIVLCCLLGALDTFGFQGTHTYFYTWAVVVQNMSPRTATFLNYTNGVWQAVIGFVGGLIMYKTKKYKWLLVAGAAIKLIAYGVMLRLRGVSLTVLSWNRADNCRLAIVGRNCSLSRVFKGGEVAWWRSSLSWLHRMLCRMPRCRR
jgi:hypothetical protein